MIDFETSLANLEALSTWYDQSGSSRNEATTRLHLIDELFFNCLGWLKDDCISEESHNGEYTDYSFYCPSRSLIVEAKKEGIYFDLPSGHNDLEVTIKTLHKLYPSISSALNQVTSYCQDRGVQFAAFSNGHQVIIFVASRSDGISVNEGKALVFSSLRHCVERFKDLWDAISKHAVQEKKLLFRLCGSTIPKPPRKLSASIHDYPGNKNRNTLQGELQVFSEIVIESAPRATQLEEEFIDQCYCQSGAISQYTMAAKSMLQTRYDKIFDPNSPAPSITPASVKGKINDDLLYDNLMQRPTILLGDVGVGKSSFIRKLIKIDIPSILDNPVCLYFDLGSKAALSQDLRSFILDDLYSQLLEDYSIDIEEDGFARSVYRGELSRFSKGIFGRLKDSDPKLYELKEIEMIDQKMRDRQSHLRSSIQHIYKGRNRQVVIFIDNADQRDDEVQQNSFLISQEFASQWEASVFIALRPSTFHNSQQKGALSGYHAKAFTISPPRIELVLEKRLAFALNFISGKTPLPTQSGDIHVKLFKLGYLIDSFLHTVRFHKEIPELLENISGGNIRLSLDLVRIFLGSGHVNTEKMVDKCQSNRRYTIPIHEFLNAVIYGDCMYYHPDRSPANTTNLFDIRFADPKEHFLSSIVIAFLSSPSFMRNNDGFVDYSFLYSSIQSLGYTSDQIDTTLNFLYSRKLVDTVGRKDPVSSSGHSSGFRVTSIGLYHINKLCHFFAYIDPIIVDTPIMDNEVRSKISDVKTLDGRLRRAEIFCDYLDAQWPNTSEFNSIFDWPSVSAGIRADINKINLIMGSS